MIQILYHDDHIAVCLKEPGILSQDGGEQSMPQLLKAQLGREVWPVHRLDKAVGGVMVYALSQKAAASMSRMVQDGTLHKAYLAVLQGIPSQPEADLTDLLFHDKMKNKTYVVKRQRKGVKEARLHYRIVETVGERSLVYVNLYTGRTHQIRVQFASRKLPLVGDGRYGGEKNADLALWSCSLTFSHPVTGKTMTFSHTPPALDVWRPYEKSIEHIL